VPGTLQTLKFAWVQYVALLIPSILIFRLVCGFIFRHQILDSSITSDLILKRRIWWIWKNSILFI